MNPDPAVRRMREDELRDFSAWTSIAGSEPVAGVSLLWIMTGVFGVRFF